MTNQYYDCFIINAQNIYLFSYALIDYDGFLLELIDFFNRI
jgi:hypothetical protein